ncbi:MAG: hypothetical protein ACREVK_07110, partial [Gammaproteobacteria bacterium]
VEILKRERRGGKDPALTSARQLGADSARTAWLLFSDADIEFPPEYIFLRLLGHEDDNIVYGPKLSRDFYIIFAKLPLGNVKTGVFSLLSNANPLDDWKNATR